MFHKPIVIIFLAVIFLLLFQLVFDVNPFIAGDYFFAQVGSAVGLSAGVPANPFNTLAGQLKEKELTLLQKEEELAQQERILKEILDNNKTDNSKTLIYFLVIGVILLGLISLNYYLDFRRKKKLDGNL